jgi:rod shape-determining protein MreC
MYWIIQFIIQHRNVSSLCLTILLSLLMLTANTTRQQQIARMLTVTVFYPFQFTLHQTTRIKNIFSENKRLKEEVTTLSTKCSLLEVAAAENERLRTLLGFDRRFTYTLIPARAVVREPSYKYRSIVISAGKKQGVSLYMPVVNKDGVVGKVIQVLPGISLVQLLRDPAERISVMIKKNNEVGILETVDSKTFFIKYRKHVEVGVDDTVVTSGLGGIYPQGIQVGIVREIKDENDPLFKDVIIHPNVDFAHIEEVFVMQLDPRWAAFRSELDSIEFDQ